MTKITPEKMAQWIIKFVLDKFEHTAREIAGALEVSDTLISRVKSGEESLSVGKLMMLADFLETPLPSLFAKAMEYNDPKLHRQYMATDAGQSTAALLDAREQLEAKTRLFQQRLNWTSRVLEVAYQSNSGEDRQRLVRMTQLANEASTSLDSTGELIELLTRLYAATAPRAVQLAAAQPLNVA